MNLTEYQEYIHRSRYARWRDDLCRRETWEETVDRYMEFIGKVDGSEFTAEPYKEVRDAILNMEVMPSMRAVASAGKAAERDNIAMYNCSYLAVDHPRAFDEAMYILLCGTGVGFSVERQYVTKLPEVSENFYDTDTTIVVGDSKLGWAKAYRQLLSLLWAGEIPNIDLSKVRPAGSKLKTFGGRASGPEPLMELFKFTIEVFRSAAGRKLTSIECHDLMCKIAEIVVVGGVRRSALISLSNLSDDRMRTAKSGNWWESNPQRALANNSACYTEKPDMNIFMQEWWSLYESKSGERGIFNREASQKTIPDRRKELGYTEFGTNPCSEIVLRNGQFCNLSEVVVRPGDTLEDLKRKVRIATIIGTIQSTFTDFRYLRSHWKKNTDEERLLGVSLTGIMDHPMLNGVSGVVGNPEDGYTGLEEWLQELREVAIETNKEWAERLGINASAAITCVKPSGTVSQLVDSASGIHPRYSNYYIRTVRADKKDPLAQFMIEKGFPHEEDFYNPNNLVFSFPIKAPDESVLTKEISAIQQLELWKLYAKYWCEHKPSVTIYVQDHEWLEVGDWVYKNFDILSGISFLPYNNHTYRQAPYQEITEEEYNKFLEKIPKDVDFYELQSFEQEDHTTGTQELSCTAGQCEI